jgi:phage terminase large subunit-like protein
MKKIASALKRLEQTKLRDAFDAYYPESRPTEKQLSILKDISAVQYRYVVAGNQSGKSQLAARDLAWVLNDEHPYFTRPVEWGTEPLTVIIAVQDLSLGSELWSKKVRPLLKDDWKEDRQGNSLKKCHNRRTGDVIYFLSHSDGSEKNRKHMQGYVAHYLWLDEMPTTHKILEELQRRVDARQGRFLATFTPKFRNDTVRRIIDAAAPPVAQKYQMSKLDNPIYAARLDEELQKLAGYSESEKRTILYGDWSMGDDAVYRFDYETMTVEELPPGYHRGWRHVESVDPALRSKCGYALWTEDPSTGIWYLVNDNYIVGTETLDPEQLYQQVMERSKGYNIVRRISDTMAWYTSTASKYGTTYMTPYDKNSRKDELIKGLQTALSGGKIKIPRWCVTFIDEVQSCQWAENSDRIINSSSFHTLDCAQYFCDNVPKFQIENSGQPWDQELRQQNAARKKAANQEQNMITKGQVRKRGGRAMGGWGRKAFGSGR